MTDDSADLELRARFVALRRHDEAQAPPFSATLSAARAQATRRRPPPAWRPVVAGVAVAAVLLAWLQAGPPHTPAEAELATTTPWRVPSDGLLNLAPTPAPALAWDSLPTASLGRPSFSRYAEDR